MQTAIGKPSPWWPFRSNIVLFVLRKDASISMTSNMHAKIVGENWNLNKSNCILYIEAQNNWFYLFIISPKYLRSASGFFISHEVYLVNISHGQPNTNTNVNQIQMQRQIRVRFDNDWNHRVQVTHVYFRLDDCFPTIWHRNKVFTCLSFIIQSW